MKRKQQQQPQEQGQQKGEQHQQSLEPQKQQQSASVTTSPGVSANTTRPTTQDTTTPFSFGFTATNANNSTPEKSPAPKTPPPKQNEEDKQKQQRLQGKSKGGALSPTAATPDDAKRVAGTSDSEHVAGMAADDATSDIDNQPPRTQQPAAKGSDSVGDRAKKQRDARALLSKKHTPRSKGPTGAANKRRSNTKRPPAAKNSHERRARTQAPSNTTTTTTPASSERAEQNADNGPASRAESGDEAEQPEMLTGIAIRKARRKDANTAHPADSDQPRSQEHQQQALGRGQLAPVRKAGFSSFASLREIEAKEQAAQATTSASPPATTGGGHGEASSQQRGINTFSFNFGSAATSTSSPSPESKKSKQSNKGNKGKQQGKQEAPSSPQATGTFSFNFAPP